MALIDSLKELHDTLRNKVDKDRGELEALESHYLNLGNTAIGPRAQSFAAGHRSALRLMLKVLYGDEGFSLREWVEMEGPAGVSWAKEEEIDNGQESTD